MYGLSTKVSGQKIGLSVFSVQHGGLPWCWSALCFVKTDPEPVSFHAHGCRALGLAVAEFHFCPDGRRDRLAGDDVDPVGIDGVDLKAGLTRQGDRVPFRVNGRNIKRLFRGNAKSTPLSDGIVDDPLVPSQDVPLRADKIPLREGLSGRAFDEPGVISVRHKAYLL